MKIVDLFFPQIAILGNNKNVAAVNRQSQGEQTRHNLSRNINAARINEAYITQVSKKVEEIIPGFQQSQTLGPLSKLYEFILSSLVRV